MIGLLPDSKPEARSPRRSADRRRRRIRNDTPNFEVFIFELVVNHSAEGQQVAIVLGASEGGGVIPCWLTNVCKRTHVHTSATQKLGVLNFSFSFDICHA